MRSLVAKVVVFAAVLLLKRKDLLVQVNHEGQELLGVQGKSREVGLDHELVGLAINFGICKHIVRVCEDRPRVCAVDGSVPS